MRTNWERRILPMLQHPKSSLRPSKGVPGAPGARGSTAGRAGVCSPPSTSTARAYSFQIRTKGSANPAAPAPRPATGAWQEQAVRARGVEMALFAKFPAKSASTGRQELSSSQELDSAPPNLSFLWSPDPIRSGTPYRVLPPGPRASPCFNGE